MPGESPFDFKTFDVYRLALDLFVWLADAVSDIPWRYRRVSDQVIAAATSVLGNLGEAAGRTRMPGESSQHLRYAQGSVHECAAYLDALLAIGQIEPEDHANREAQLARIGSMITRMIQRHERWRHSQPRR